MALTIVSMISRLGDSFKPTLNVEPTDTFEDELRITGDKIWAVHTTSI